MDGWWWEQGLPLLEGKVIVKGKKLEYDPYGNKFELETSE